MSPILLRPIREQFEHNRVIRLLQSRLRRRYVVAVNLEDEREATGVRSGTDLVYPDLVLTSTTGARRLHGVVEIETAESVNRLEAMAEWVHFGKVRGAFYLYVPAGATDVTLRLCEEYAIAVTEIWSYLAVGDQMRFTMTYRSTRAASRAAAAARRVAANGPRTSKGAKRGAGTPRRTVVSTPPNAKPVTRAAKPVTRAAKPATRTAKPATRTTKPATRTTKPVTRAAKPATRAAKPATRAAKPARRTAKPATRTAKPARRAAKPARRAAKPATRAAKPATRTTKPATAHDQACEAHDQACEAHDQAREAHDQAREAHDQACKAHGQDRNARCRRGARPVRTEEVGFEDGRNRQQGHQEDGDGCPAPDLVRPADLIPREHIGRRQVGVEGALAVERRRDEEDGHDVPPITEAPLTAILTDRMPFLRFSRDKRGYENTYLCHTFRRGGEPRLRVLYWFRTPPDVKVGRLALDPGAIRAIEDSNPDLKFDWGKILKVKPPPPPPVYGRDGRQERAWRRRGRAADAATAPPAPDSTSATGQGSAREPVVLVESEAERSAQDPSFDGPAPAAVVWDDLDSDGEPAGTPERRSAHVVLGLIDEQGLARLRARHAEIQARISERVRDPAKLEELRAQAALLDPDAWRTLDEARERLASLDEATGAIRKVLGRRRRTRRGGARRRRREGDRGDTKVASDSERAGSPVGPLPAEPSQPPRDEGDDPRDE